MVSNKIESKVISQTKQLAVWTLILASFLEGGMVMVVELAGAKIIAPYYGTSLYVWASILGVTVGALAAGYFLGGWFSKYFLSSNILWKLFGAGAFFTFLIPFAASFILESTASWPLLLAITISPLLFLFPPVLCMGAVSPILIQAIKDHGTRAGSATGNIYAISTVGGIAATLGASFYLIPYLGIRFSLWATAILMAGVGLLWMLGTKNVQKSSFKVVKKSVKKVFRTLPVSILLTLSFLEGGVLMIVELLGAKIAAPYYGTSLYVWGSVLAVTLAALSLGYYLGGRLSVNAKTLELRLFLLLLGAAFMIGLAPLIAPTIMSTMDFAGVRGGALLSVLIYLLPPVTLLAMVSPIITHLISPNFKAGKAAGTVYAISTVGGIVGTFLGGFILIPALGIKTLAIATAALIGLLAIIYCFFQQKYRPIQLAGLLLTLIIVFAPKAKNSDSINVLYHSSGILGEWTVADYLNTQVGNTFQVERRLLLNGIDQTYTQIGYEPLSLWNYPHKLGAYASMKPAGSKALLLGMGGGSIAYELVELGFDLDIVEMDKRIEHIAKEYFKYDPASSDLIIDDARHFIRNAEETYDLVIIDLLLGEVQPAHVLSLEGFLDLKKVIAEDALVMVNFQGNVYQPEFNRGPISVFKTMQAAGYEVAYFSSKGVDSRSEKELAGGDVYFIASPSKQNYQAMMQNLRYNEWSELEDFTYKDLITIVPLDLSGAEVLIDDKPKLELLNAEEILRWRKNKMEGNVKRMVEEGIRIY